MINPKRIEKVSLKEKIKKVLPKTKKQKVKEAKEKLNESVKKH